MSERPAEYNEAMANLDKVGTVMANGATIAPDFVMRTLIALRRVLERHQPQSRYALWCGVCSHEWPCGTTRDVFGVFGVEEDADV